MKTPASDPNRTVIVSINDVEPGLVKATKMLSKELDRELEGIVVIDESYLNSMYRVADTSGSFTEIVVDYNDPEQLQEALKPYQDRLLAATCRIEIGIQFFQKIIPFLPYIYTPSPESLRWATEKNQMRDRFHIHNPELGPKYMLIHEYNETTAKTVADTMSFPVIVKPSGLAQSLLVKKCRNTTELDNAIRSAFKHMDRTYAREQGRGEKDLLIEELMPGDMYSIDAYVDQVGTVYCLAPVHVTTADSVGHEGFYSYELRTDSGLAADEVKGAELATEDALKALQLRSCSAHVELFLHEGTWKIIEVGPRIGGYREDLYREAHGIEHFYNDLRNRIGLPPEIAPTKQAYAGGVNIYAEEEGVITSVTGLEEAQKLPSIVYLKQHLAEGDEALFCGNGGHFIVDGILSHENQDQLERDMKKVRELIDIKVA